MYNTLLVSFPRRFQGAVCLQAVLDDFYLLVASLCCYILHSTHLLEFVPERGSAEMLNGKSSPAAVVGVPHAGDRLLTRTSQTSINVPRRSRRLNAESVQSFKVRERATRKDMLLMM